MHLIPALLLAAALQQQSVQVDRVRIQPSEPEVEVDASRTLEATLLDANGEPIPGASAQWFLIEGDAVQLAPDGTVIGIRPGRASIAAVFGRNAGFVEVVVPALPASELTASLPSERIPRGASAPLMVRAVDRIGTVITDPELRFSSDDPSIAEVDSNGRVFAMAAGETRIEVRSGSASASVPVRVAATEDLSFVLSPERTSVRTGDVVRFRVEARAAGTNTGSMFSVYPGWTVEGSGASIEAEGADGVFVAEDPGTYTITAAVGENESRTAVVEVEPRMDESELVLLGRGPVSTHHSGDLWVFEGVDGRDYAYLGTFLHDWMKAWDVTDPTRPVLTDSVQVDARRINDVKIHPNGRIAVITREGASDRRNGIVLLDLTDPAHPTVLSEYEQTVTGGVHNVWIDGEDELIYAVHDGTMDMHILDISDPTDVREVGRWGLDRAVKTLHDVMVVDGYAYLSYWDDGLVILDVGAGSHGGTPTSPTFVSRIEYPEGNTHVAWRHGDYVFVGDEIFPEGWNPDQPIHTRGYIHVIDVSDIENPREVAKYEVPEAGVHNVWVEGDLMYVGYYQAGLRVVDISGELRGDLYEQGREIARMRTTDDQTMVPNWPMAWGAQLYKGNIFSSDFNSGIWVTRLVEDGQTVF